MKTEQQSTEKLQSLVSHLNNLAITLPPDQLANKTLPPEQEKQVACLVGMLLILAWILDCEDEVKPLLNTLQMESITEKLN